MNALLLAWSLAAPLSAAPAPAYKAEIEAWRQKREAKLRSEHGWLAVSGLFWLHPGRNVLPSPFDKAGWFELEGGKAVARIGTAVKELKDDDDETGVEFGRYIFELHASGERRGIRVWDRDNPRRKSFPGLHWYRVDDSYRIHAKFVPYEKPKSLVVQNISGDAERTDIPGYAVFNIKGKELRLEGWVEDSKLFFVFRDKTSGKETYPTARFLVADMPKDATMTLDFNKAYTPPCAFSPFATCPLPPAGNRLDVAVEAGEKRPPGSH